MQYYNKQYKVFIIARYAAIQNLLEDITSVETFYENSEEDESERVVEDSVKKEISRELSPLPRLIITSTRAHSEHGSRSPSPDLFGSDEELVSTSSSDLDDVIAGGLSGGANNSVQTLERALLSNFYMQHAPERERYYHMIEGNRMSFYRFDETNVMDRTVNECKQFHVENMFVSNTLQEDVGINSVSRFNSLALDTYARRIKFVRRAQ